MSAVAVGIVGLVLVRFAPVSHFFWLGFALLAGAGVVLWGTVKLRGNAE